MDISKTKADVPVQPQISFPADHKKRKFSANYYAIHSWIEYSVKKDAVYCFPCRHFSGFSLFKGEKENCRAFIDKGFNKWKDMSSLFLQ